MTLVPITGWLFDVDDLGPTIALWVYDDAGRLHRLREAFQAPVYARGERARLKGLAAEFARRGWITGVRWTERREFWSGETIEVLQFNVADAASQRRICETAGRIDREATFYDLDIPVTQHYLYLRRLFPLCRLEALADAQGNLVEIAATNSAWELDHPLPPLRVMRLRGERMRPLNGQSRLRIATAEGETVLRLADGAAAIHSFNALLERADPDLILSERGDSILFPALLALAQRTGVALRLDRDPVVTKRRIETEGRTYYSYGNIVYKPPSYPLFGRWHIDRESSFAHHETGLEGLLELARLSRVPVQRMARRSPGLAMTSMQMDRAIHDGLLIPWRKNEPEKPKTALDLLTIDKGGLTYQPILGEHANVIEIDFASMYPSLMVARNISPETVLCGCCENRAVPEAGYNICAKRRGLIPRTLEPLIARRKRYKQLLAEADAPTRAIYEARRAAIKWMLVTCFGYMGYRNARMGRIEAHEAVTAWGRETLLRAKEIAEEAGYEMLHALTDSLWLRKPSAPKEAEDEIRALCDAITEATGIEMALEGVYRWIAFLPSTGNAARPVAARFYGAFADGTMKVRGLACRRRDTPAYLRDVQEELLAILAEARDLDELPAQREAAARVYEQRRAELAAGAVDPRRLIVEQVVSRELDEYAVETRASLAARELVADGVPVHPGERIGYVITDAKAPDRAARVRTAHREGDVSYDRREYLVRLARVAREVLQGSE